MFLFSHLFWTRLKMLLLLKKSFLMLLVNLIVVLMLLLKINKLLSWLVFRSYNKCCAVLEKCINYTVRPITCPFTLYVVIECLKNLRWTVVFGKTRWTLILGPRSIDGACYAMSNYICLATQYTQILTLFSLVRLMCPYLLHFFGICSYFIRKHIIFL